MASLFPLLLAFGGSLLASPVSAPTSVRLVAGLREAQPARFRLWAGPGGSEGAPLSGGHMGAEGEPAVGGPADEPSESVALFPALGTGRSALSQRISDRAALVFCFRPELKLRFGPRRFDAALYPAAHWMPEEELNDGGGWWPEETLERPEQRLMRAFR